MALTAFDLVDMDTTNRESGVNLDKYVSLMLKTRLEEANVIPYMKHGTKPEEVPIDLTMDDFQSVGDGDRPIADRRPVRSEKVRREARSGIPYAGQHPESAEALTVRTPDGKEYIANEIKIDYQDGICQG